MPDAPDRAEHDEAADTFPPGLSQPARRALHGAGYTTLDQVATATEAELLRLHGMGPKGIRILREALHARGQSFAAGEAR